MASVEEYNKMLDELDRSRIPSLSVELASPSPELSSNAVRLTEETGFPVPPIPNAVTQAEAEQKKARDREALKTAPRAREFLSVQENANVSSDDVSQLAGIEWLLRAPSEAMQKGLATNELGRLGFQSMFTTGDRKGMDEATNQRVLQLQALTRADLGDEAFLPSIVTATAELLGQVAEPIRETLPAAIEAGLVAGGAAAIAGQIPPLTAVPEELVTVPTAGVALFGVTMQAGMIANAFEVEAGQAYLEYMDLKDLDGNQSMDRDVARGAALVVGTLNAALEGLGMRFVLRGTGLSKLAERLGKDEVAALFAKPTIRQAFKRAGVAWARTWGGEVSTELVQEVVAAVGGELAKAADDGSYLDMTREEFATRMAEIVEKVGKGMLIPAGVGAAASFSYDASRAKKAQANVEVFEALGDLSSESKLNERLPARFAEFVDQVTEDGPVDSVYIGVDEFTEYFQSQGIDIADVAEELPSVAEQADAFVSGGDVRIPLGEYASKIAPSEHHAGLLKHLRFRPEDMSASQAELFEKNFGKQFREEVAAEVTRVEALAESEQPADAVYQNITQQLIQAGRDPEVAKREALVWRSFFKVMGERTGLDPQESFRALQVRVRQREESDQQIETQNRELFQSGAKAAVKVDDQIFTGASHQEAVGKALNAGAITWTTEEGRSPRVQLLSTSTGSTIDADLFELEGGEVVSRSEAMTRLGFATSETLRDLRKVGDERFQVVGFPDPRAQLQELDQGQLLRLLQHIDPQGSYEVTPATVPPVLISERKGGFYTHTQTDEGGLEALTAVGVPKQVIEETGPFPTLEEAQASRQEIIARIERANEEFVPLEREAALAQADEMLFGEDAKLHGVTPADAARLMRETGLLQEREFFQSGASAAIRVDDQLFTGATHGDAINKALEAGALVRVEDEKALFGVFASAKTGKRPDIDLFKLKGGEVISRSEAFDRFGFASSEERDESARLSALAEQGAKPFFQTIEKAGIPIAKDEAFTAKPEDQDVPEALATYRDEQEKVAPFHEVQEPFQNKDGSFRKNPKGDITGAPPGIKTKRNISTLVTALLRKLESPLAQIETSSEWYEVSGRAIRRITRGDPELTEKIVRLMAVLSADNQVGGNVTAAVKAIYQIARGEEPASGRYPNTFRERAPAILAAEQMSLDTPGISDKVLNFYRNLWDATFVSDRFENAATMDLWMARVYGYSEVARMEYGQQTGTTNRLGQAQYRFSNHLNRLVADRYNKKHGTTLLPRQIQAAMWVYARNRDTYGESVGSTVLTEGTRASFDQYIERATQNITVEAVPSEASGAFPEILDASDAAKDQYTREAFSLLLDEDGANQLFALSGIPLGGEVAGAGAYEGRVSPNEIVKVVAEKNAGKYDDAKADLAARVLQYIYSQDAVPWMQFDPSATGKDVARGVAVEFAQNPTREAQEAFYAHLQGALPDAGFSVVDNQIVVVNFRGPDGKPFSGINDKKFTAAVEEAAATYKGPGSPDILSVGTLKSRGNYLDIEDLQDGGWRDPGAAAKALEGAISAGGSPALLDWARSRRKAVEALNADFAARLESAQAGGVTLFQDRATRRGSVQFPAEGLGAGETVINLFESADLSTFLHESGHVFLEAFGQFAIRPDASEQVRADWQATLKYLGAKPDRAFTEEQHEKWARTFEAYLREGVAPSLELASAFARFQAWFLRIYRDVKASLGIKLNDEIRQVFDRLLASDEEIEAARAYMNMKPLFTEAEAAGMSPTEQQQYLKLVAEDTLEAKKRLQTRMMKELARAEKEWWRTESAKVAEEVEADINARPIYRALHFLQTGEPLTGELPEGLEPMKLDKATLIERFGEGIMANLPAGPRIYAENGVDPDVVAEVFGFNSGAELVIPLQSLVPRKRAIKAEVARIMNERHGDMLSDGTLKEAALDEAHKGDKHLRVLERELTVLSRRAGTPPTPRQVARQLAAEILSSKRVADAMRFATYLQAERKFARATEKALAKGDALAAVQAKRQQLINHHLYNESRKIAREVEKGLALAKRLNTPGARKAIAPDYLEQIDALLQDYDFSKGTSLAKQERREALRAFVQRKLEENEAIAIPDEVIDDAGRKSYKALPVEEFRAVVDSIRNLRHLGRMKNKLLLDLQKRELEKAVDDVVTSMEANSVPRSRLEIETRQPSEEARVSFADWFASHRKLSSLARAFDGFKDNGVFWNLFIRPMNTRGDWEADQFSAATRDLWGVFKENLGGYFNLREGVKGEAQIRTFGKAPGKPPLMQKTYIPSINRSLTREGMIAVALNWGNETNQRRIMDGYGWSAEQVQDILNNLTREEWGFVQGIWDYIDTFWEQIAEKERRVTGVAPTKVEATPVQTPFGEFQGGYYPIAYDDRQSPRAFADIARETAENAMRGNYVRASTKRGHTKERAAGDVQRPVRLDFGVVFEHAQQVVHDLAWHEWLIDANKLVGHKRFQAAVIELYGKPIYDQLRTGIESIATGDMAAQTAFERSINWLRTGVSIAGMGWSIWTSLLQPTGLSQGLTRVGPKYMGRAFAEWFGDAARMESTLERIYGKSLFMKNRVRTQMREINEIRNKVRKAGTTTAVQDSFFWMITRAQLVADVPIWLGAYHKSLDSGTDEATAISVADQMVLDTQSGGQIKDLAAIQRGSPLMKLWTNFYSYFSATYNLTAESHGKLKLEGYSDPFALGRFAVDMMLIYIVPATVSALMYEALRGDGEGDDLLENIIRENLQYMTGVMVGLREMGSAVSGFYGYEGPAGTRFFSELSNLMRQVSQAEADAALWKSLNNTAGILFHYPAAQIGRTAAGFSALMEGRESNPMVLLMGPPRK